MYIAVFRSRNQAMRFSQALNKHGLSSQTVSTPVSLNLGCGLSVTVEEESRALAERVLSSMCLNAFVMWYQLCQDEYFS